MREVIGLFVQIALLRRGPQDLPASILLLLLTLAGYLAVNALVSSLLPVTADWPAQLAVEVLFTLGWYAGLLRLVGRRERFVQTATGVFGLRTLIAPAVTACAWLSRRFEHDGTWQLPIAVAGLALVIWLIAANSHVVKAALEWSSAASVALVILQIVSGQLLLFALFSPGG
ncbi:MAG TPA: hypothetical protein VET46_14340 [Steroidobacteraceae bacterium]|nr:hypothetical protein [Steroidobacteraceae bacterium]